MSDIANVDRGFVGALEPCIIKTPGGRVIWDGNSHSFLQGIECPKTANPKLWRQGQLCSKQGLFEVTEGIFQVRGLDISNMTLVEGDLGVIVIDPLVSVECAEAALNLYRTHRGDRPVTALIYTHSHLDHFGGARGVLPKGLDDVPIVAPEGFLEHAVSENLYVGNAMMRRAMFMYGDKLPRAPDGHIGVGLGLDTSTGTTSLIPPNLHISKTGQTEILDGVPIVFQVTPGTEAPAEMNFHFPRHRALCMAENTTHNLHNILTLRGAVVRDARAWSRYIDEAMTLFSDESDVVFASHHWPTWGLEAIVHFLSEQRDLYAYLHDQTLRLINEGWTGIEIAENLSLPPVLQACWHTQGFYGSISHNVKAIYQRYLGWFDGNPVHLWEHPPAEAAHRYVSCMGGVDEVVRKAEEFVDHGDLRFAATLLGHTLFSHPEHSGARNALASVLDQLGQGAENGPWRNYYLTGALELRAGPSKTPIALGNTESAKGLSMDQLLDWLAIRLDGPKAEDLAFVIDLCLKDHPQTWQLTLSNGALTHRMLSPSRRSPHTAKLTCMLTKTDFVELLFSERRTDQIEAKGDLSLLTTLLALLVTPDSGFPIMCPKSTASAIA